MREFVEQFGAFILAIVAIVMSITIILVLKSPTQESLDVAEEKLINVASGDIVPTLGEYSITYDLDGGFFEEANAVTYSNYTDTFTLNNPKRYHATFLGWTGSNGNTPEMTVSIVKGTTGDLYFKANWEYEYLYGYQIVDTWDSNYLEERPDTYYYKTYSGYKIEKYKSCSLSTRKAGTYSFSYNSKYVNCSEKEEDDIVTAIKSFSDDAYYDSTNSVFYKVVDSNISLYALPKTWKQVESVNTKDEALSYKARGVKPVYSNDGGSTWKEITN